MKKSTLIKKLEAKFPGIEIFDHDEFGISAESGTLDNKGWPIGDYYDGPFFDPEEYHQRFGISLEVLDFLKASGWGAEWINPGMIGLHKEN